MNILQSKANQRFGIFEPSLRMLLKHEIREQSNWCAHKSSTKQHLTMNKSTSVPILCRQLLAVLLAFSLAGANHACGQAIAEAPVQVESAQDHASQISSLLDQYLGFGQLNGVVLVAENGKTIVRQGFGKANMEWDVPNRPDTIFRIGSVTKQFTAALILQLVEEGKVKLDEPMTTYLSDYREDTGAKVTVHDLLCHTSGIPSYTNPDFFEKHSRDSYELDEFIERFASGDLEFEPGSQFAYNNSGYHLLGAIIESVTGQSYADTLHDRILKPLGMTNSGFDVSSTILKRRAQGYSKTADGFENAAYLNMEIPYSAGSMYSTVDDLLKWHHALRNDKVFSAETKKLMQTPNKNNYGYGVSIKQREIKTSGETTTIVSHGGGINGFNCLLSRAVDEDHVVVILDNAEMGQFHGAITEAIFNILFDQPYKQPRKSLYDELVGLKPNGAEEIVAKYRSLRNDHPDTYDFDNEEALNRLGHELLRDDKAKDAIEIFKLNLESFSDKYSAYDSLGEAYRKNEQQDLAKKNFKKSIELNPEGQVAKLALQQLEGKAPEIDPMVLKKYVGKYEISPGFVVTISLEEGVLMGQPTGQNKVALESVSETEFLVPSVRANVQFVMNDEGEVTELVLKQAGNDATAKKIDSPEE